MKAVFPSPLSVSILNNVAIFLKITLFFKLLYFLDTA